MFKNINTQMIAGTIVHILVAIGTHVAIIEDPELRELANEFPILLTITDFIFIISIFMNFLGMFLIIINKIKIGITIYTIGCFIFVPSGLIGIFGAIKIDNKLKEEDFSKKRNKLLGK